MRFFVVFEPLIIVVEARVQVQIFEARVSSSLRFMGLNDIYVGVKSNILMLQPLSSLENAYNILLQDEKQRQVNPGS